MCFSRPYAPIPLGLRPWRSSRFIKILKNIIERHRSGIFFGNYASMYAPATFICASLGACNAVTVRWWCSHNAQGDVTCDAVALSLHSSTASYIKQRKPKKKQYFNWRWTSLVALAMRSLYADGDPTTLKEMSLRCCYAVGISTTLTLRQRSLCYDGSKHSRRSVSHAVSRCLYYDLMYSWCHMMSHLMIMLRSCYGQCRFDHFLDRFDTVVTSSPSGTGVLRWYKSWTLYR